MDNYTQALVGQWILSTGEIPEGYQMAHLGSENEELLHEWNNGRNPELLRGELADVGIALLGIAAEQGIDLQAAMLEKMAQVYLKYPPDLIRELQEKEKMTRAEAFAYMKELWEKNQ